MIKGIPKSDITTRPFEVYKEWSFSSSELAPRYGIEGEPYYTDEDDEQIPQTALYHSIKRQFYEDSDRASLLSEVGRRRNYASKDERVLDGDIAVIALSQAHYGEGILPKSVELEFGQTELTDDGYSNLIDSDETIHGNVFYDRGIIVVTKDVDVEADTLDGYILTYRSTMTIYENEYLIVIKEHEFNASQNPSAVDENKNIKKDFLDYQYSSSLDPTGSYLTPFVSTIGLYNDQNEMVAVAKLPKSIKCYPDYPMNFIVRLDT